MPNTNIKLHYYQAQIMHILVTKHVVRFNDLILPGLESEHMNYHLKKLIDLGLVQKVADGYSLTDNGKEYSNLLDDGVEVIEKQPKTSVLIRGLRVNERGEVEHLLYKRMRQPYLGMVGKLGGKVRFGEMLEQAAARELYEETGLVAKNYHLEEVYHKLRRNDKGELVQDVIFYIFFATEFSGEFIQKTEFQENLWITKAGLAERKDLQGFDDLDLDDSLELKPLRLVENVAHAQNF